jgi:hypothetical protein
MIESTHLRVTKILAYAPVEMLWSLFRLLSERVTLVAGLNRVLELVPDSRVNS